MVLITDSQSRKERRKQERKKRKQHPGQHNTDVAAPTERGPAPKLKKVKKEISKKSIQSEPKKKEKEDPYGHLGPGLAAAISRDDDDIADLESKLGLRKNKKSKEKLNKEYARLEGYGDDFGDFLDDLENLVHRVSGRDADKDYHAYEQGESDEENLLSAEQSDDYDGMDPSMAAAMKRDDDEIADLEHRLGLGKKKEKSKLRNQYKAEGFGDDFGDFLDDLDDMVVRVKDKSNTTNYDMKDHGAESENDSDGEELVPMKDPSYDEIDEDDSVLDELEREDGNAMDDDPEEFKEEDTEAQRTRSFQDDEHGSSEGEEGSSEDEGSDKEEPDHDLSDTYRPSQGEDIYGKNVDGDGAQGTKPTKYVPPHLRNKQGGDDDNEEKKLAIRRGLNNALNRLSEDTMASVAQQVAQLYSTFPTHMVHEMLWKNTKDACILSPMLMTGLIPIYLACIVGVHIQSGDTVQVGEYMLEAAVSELWQELLLFRQRDPNDEEKEGIPREIASKHICNRLLVLCYLYNYGIVHCSFMYDIVRHLIEKFSEVDIESLLLLLGHCGRSLRSDDPLALKEIVLLVQKKRTEESSTISSSRVEYMVSAIADLKNNKRRKQDTAYGEKTAKMRKLLGQVKSAAAKSNTSKTSSESTLRISMKDILNADTKGRWWKVGASWVGNQYRFSGDGDGEGGKESGEETSVKKSTNIGSEQDEALLKLASKFRMNTDRKRSIFCIVMGSEDCEDAFEKLCRSSMLQNRSERDTCRVLLECCCNEKSYNKFYGHLASRMCEFQPQCKFSLQLAYWDMFKQFDSIDARKAANLAKFLLDLVVTHQLLKLMTVVKAMDISEDEMEESSMIFLTILLSSILNYFDDTAPIKVLFASRQGQHEDPSKFEQEEGARASLLVFFMETLKASPQNKKGTQFRKNLKAAVKALDTDGFESMF